LPQAALRGVSVDSITVSLVAVADLRTTGAMSVSNTSSDPEFITLDRSTVQKLCTAAEFHLVEAALFADPASLKPAARRKLLAQLRKLRGKFRDQKQRQRAAQRGKAVAGHRKPVDAELMAQKRDLFGAAIAVLEAEAPIVAAATPKQAKKKGKKVAKKAAKKAAKKSAKKAGKKTAQKAAKKPAKKSQRKSGK